MALATLIVSCAKARKKSIFPHDAVHVKMHYTERFGIADCRDSSILYYLNGDDTIRLLSSAEVPAGGFQTVLLSSVYAGFALALNAGENVCGVDNIRFYFDSGFHAKFKAGKISETGEEMQLRHEVLLNTAPSVVIGTDVLYKDENLRVKLKKSGVYLLVCDNYRELHPLARAEWIRFFGFVYNKRKEADSIFQRVAASYIKLAEARGHTSENPVVLTDAMYMDAWNVPGNLTYTAQLIRDAGGTYVFGELNKAHTYPLGFEKVLRTASDADVWLHVNRYRNREEMLNDDERYGMFKAFRNASVYNNNKREREWGANDFWESGVVRPDLILNDLKKILSGNHPETDSLFYYTRLD